MQAFQFVEEVRNRVVKEGVIECADLLSNTANATDPIWGGIIPVYRNLSAEQKEVFINFIRMISVNTVSHLFGILDGSSYLAENAGDFELISKEDGNVLNGDLQDVFLALEESN